MLPGERHSPNTRRRATVLVMVVGVLAMLFIVGSSLLIVSRFERQTAEAHADARNLETVGVVITDPIIAQLREDVVGTDSRPYNRGWDGDSSIIEDFADFPGSRSDQAGDVRNGDLLLSSAEPYCDEDDTWRLFAASCAVDALLAGDLSPVRNMRLELGGPGRDATGDGVRDSADKIFGDLSGMFGGGYEMHLRVVPHGGMVLIDPLTHPSLLAQVIHPQDGAFHTDPFSLWSAPDPLAIDQAVDERSLRRRFMLPRQESSPSPASLEYKLPVTLGLQAPSGAPSWFQDLTPHSWPIDNAYGDERDWWEARITPGDNQGRTLTHPGYTAGTDLYDRRHLITTANYDDLLRRQREERRLRAFIDPGNGQTFFNAINPDATAPSAEAYGLDPTGTTLVFNRPGLRTQFSLRDVLEAGGPGASYRRAVQLTAYFLAMIQHTSVLGTSALNPSAAERAEQLRTAAQLAVNTIDFADGDDVPSYFEWPPGGSPIVNVVGVEKQPFITEAYAKIIQAPKLPLPADPADYEWDELDAPTNPANSFVYAVELYNPYDTPIPLSDGANGHYELRIGGGTVPVSGPGIDSILPHTYLVVTSAPDWAGLGMTAPVGGQLLQKSSMTINRRDSVELVRRTINDLNKMPGYQVHDPLVVDVEVVVDVLKPVNLGADESWWARPGWVSAEDVYADTDPINGIRRPDDADSKLVRDSSLQRHKEIAGAPPIFWHCTLSRQMVLPLRIQAPYSPDGGATWAWKEVDLGASSGPDPVAGLVDDPNDPGYVPQHSLVGLGPGSAGFSIQQFVKRDILGLPYDIEIPNPGNLDGLGSPIIQNIFVAKDAIAPFPILVSALTLPESPHLYPDGSPYTRDWVYTFPGSPAPSSIFVTFDGTTTIGVGDTIQIRTGTGALVGTYTDTALAGATVEVPHSTLVVRLITDGAATLDSWGFRVLNIVANDGPAPPVFPTTGTLHLVTRYAHARTPPHPVTVAATQALPGVVRTNPPNPAREPVLQMQQVDNGHLPIFDIMQCCTDTYPDPNYGNLPQGRLDVPWGQLVFDYFTALPLEELTRRFDLEALLGSTFAGLNDTALLDLTDDGLYEIAYGALFPGYPVVERVSEADSPLGPRVRGRINTNFAPWWVLDGLPVLNDAAQLPVPEIRSGLLDPAAALPQEKAGLRFVSMLTENVTVGGAPFSNVSPDLARYMVSYREQRPVDGLTNDLANLPHNPGDPGFLTVGALCNALTQIPVAVEADGEPVIHESTGPQDPERPKTIHELRDHSYRQTANDPNTTVKPFGYLGYLQLVAPVVRLQDWATVKNHVFTIYTTISTTSQPPVHLRTQVTVDRTRCLYTNDLPARISEIEPIGYYNAVND